MLMHPVYGNACEQNFPDGSLDAAYSTTCMHEILSFQGPAGLRRALEVTFRELRSGVFVIVDMVIPDETEPVFMLLPDGDDKSASLTDTLSEIEQLSTFELFKRFHRDFRGGDSFDYVTESIDGKNYIKLAPEWAYEFYMRKDYRRNYHNEIHEKYAPWTAAQARQLLQDAGFVDIELHPSHNVWIIKNRLEGQISLHRRNEHGTLEAIEFPPTHLTIVAHKRGAPSQVNTPNSLSLFEAKVAIKNVLIDREHGVLNVGDTEFKIDTDRISQGTKRSVFYRNDPAGTVIKIPRVDSTNPHNAFKAMFQSIERQHVLIQYDVPHLEIVDFDRNGPPYRYLEQRQLPDYARCAADLILTGELTETDVQQMAQIINRFELEGRWQLDTNPYNWFRVNEASEQTQMIYADGKVYLYDEQWAFTRKGLLQWLLPELLPGPSSAVEHQCAFIPREVLSDDIALWWNAERPMVGWWRKYLDPELVARLEISEV
jgi:hypothetical protein